MSVIVKVKQCALVGCLPICGTWLCPGGVVHRSLLTLFEVCTLKRSFNPDDGLEELYQMLICFHDDCRIMEGGGW